MLISTSGLIKLGDFGLAEQLNHSNSERSNTCGTLLYMGPEVFDGQTGLKSDVWSLGISLIELAEGKNPYNDGYGSPATVMKRICMDAPPSLSSPVWSAGFVDFVNKCLKREMSERWSVNELMEVNGFSHDSSVAPLREGFSDKD
ncbi:hypothetical protein BLSTO_00127 [Blastocystis sp. subtype 1]